MGFRKNRESVLPAAPVEIKAAAEAPVVSEKVEETPKLSEVKNDTGASALLVSVATDDDDEQAKSASKNVKKIKNALREQD